MAASFRHKPSIAVIDRRHLLGLFATACVLPSKAFADVAQQRSEFREVLAKRFIDEETVGTFVGYRVDEYLIIASDKERSGEGKLPASTFKIPNSLIALETGVVADPDKDVFKWDGVKRSIEAWNQDHTMRSAIAVSAVPVYQEIARRIGEARMQKYVDLLEYGNRNIGGGIDQFWLTGDLRIDPIQQIDFVDRLGAARCRSPNAARIWCATSCPLPRSATRSFAPRAACWAPRSASPRWAGWSAGSKTAIRRRCLR